MSVSQQVSRALGMLAVAAIVAGSFSSAQATTSDFTVANINTSPVTEPYGSISLTCSSFTRCVMELTPIGGNVFFGTNALDFNLEADFTVSSVTSTGSGAASFSFGSFGPTGFGGFQWQVDLSGGTTGGVNSSESLTVNLTGNGFFLNVPNGLLIFNANGFAAEGNVFNTTLGASCLFSVGDGVGAVTPTTSNCGSVGVPEPASLGVLGTALIGFGLLLITYRRMPATVQRWPVLVRLYSRST